MIGDSTRSRSAVIASSAIQPRHGPNFCDLGTLNTPRQSTTAIDMASRVISSLMKTSPPQRGRACIGREMRLDQASRDQPLAGDEIEPDEAVDAEAVGAQA